MGCPFVIDAQYVCLDFDGLPTYLILLSKQKNEGEALGNHRSNNRGYYSFAMYHNCSSPVLNESLVISLVCLFPVFTISTLVVSISRSNTQTTTS